MLPARRQGPGLIESKRLPHTRLGYAVQLTTLLFIGRFLADPTDVPTEVVDYLAEQLDIADPSCLKDYRVREMTRLEHAGQIRDAYGFVEFTAAAEELARWVDDRAWTTGDGPKALFDGAVVWLREHRVLLPGVSTLARLVARVRDAAMARLWDTLAAPLTAAQASALEQLTTTVTPVTDTTLVGRELTELRELEGELDYEDPRGEVYAHAIELLEQQLRSSAKDAGVTRSWGDYVAGADDGWVVYRAPWDGPVVQAWQTNLTPIDDLQAVLRRRRVRRLLGYHEPDRVRAGYREPDGRYVLVIEYANGSCWSAAEWPASLQVVATWTDQTVLAGDDPGGGHSDDRLAAEVASLRERFTAARDDAVGRPAADGLAGGPDADIDGASEATRADMQDLQDRGLGEGGVAEAGLGT